MAVSRFALWLLTQAEHAGAREALVGDLLEEIARGRSSYWTWQQLAGWGGIALLAQARERARLTPHMVALACGAGLAGAVSVAPMGSVLETWITFYMAAGTASLFAHVTARSAGSRTLRIPADAEAPRDR